EEFDWIGQDIAIGDCVLRPRERTDRCLATHTNPETGTRDVDILKALAHFGHQDFTVRAEVIKGGRIANGDIVQVVS
ncbi:MAG: molybdenum cofactor biosysynthesis protein, partial [Pseudomonadota bacterium]